MSRTRRISLALFLVCASTLVAQPAPESAKAGKARQLLVAMKAGDMGVAVIDNMIASMKRSMPDVPSEFWTSFRKQVHASDLMDMVVPIYVKNIEEADLDELLRFYTSPSGQRFVAKQGLIMQEAMTAGQAWGQQLAQKAIEELQAKGYGPK
jgi:uncharacterized protein